MLLLQLLFAVTSLATLLAADEKLPELVTVCEATHDLQAYDHKVVFLMGRIAKHNNERTIGEDSCEGSTSVPVLRIQLNSAAGPRPPNQMVLDASAAKRKFVQIGQRTKLHQFRFGSGDSEQWGIVFGRLELNGAALDASTILCRGEALIFPWNER